MTNITRRQADVLSVLDGSSSLTASEVGDYHLPIGASSARAALSSLERKGFVAADYTGHGGRGRAYAITHAGANALAALDEDDTESIASWRRCKAELSWGDICTMRKGHAGAHGVDLVT